MGSAAVEKTEDELRKEIDELQRQQREITERLRDPRGLRKRGLSGAGSRSFPANGVHQRGFVRPAEWNESEDQPPAKRRLSSAVVKVEDGELLEDTDYGEDMKKDSTREGISGTGAAEQSNGKSSIAHQSGWSRRDGNQRTSKMDYGIPTAEHVPRVLPKNEDPSLVNRNKRMLGQLLGTLEKFRKEGVQLSSIQKLRSDSLQRAEQRAREASERLRKQEREQIAEKRRRDLILRARVAAKTEEKKLELLFLQWSDHHKRLSNFIRTKAEPPIYYLPNKPLDEDATSAEKQKEAFLEWKNARREELSDYQKQIGEQYIANVEKELERWQNARKMRKVSNDQNLHKTMDKELDTHRLEHGPKKRKIPGGSNEDDDDVEDINVGEDDILDDVLVEDDSGRRVDETKVEAGNTSADPAADVKNMDQK